MEKEEKEARELLTEDLEFIYAWECEKGCIHYVHSFGLTYPDGKEPQFFIKKGFLKRDYRVAMLAKEETEEDLESERKNYLKRMNKFKTCYFFSFGFKKYLGSHTPTLHIKPALR